MIFTVTASLLGLLALSIPVGIVLFLLGIGVDQLFSPFPLLRGLGQVIWSASNSSTLIAIPFFVLLGEILVRGGIAERTYEALDKWFSWLPGGLIHANIGTATMFSATSGSSVATAATVATVAMPQAEKLGYDPKLFSGAIAAGGTLGIMIPPSINLIVCKIKPTLGGSSRSFSWSERFGSLRHLMPIIILFFVVIGSIYAGWATPTESAAVGVAIAFLIAAFNRGVSREMMCHCLYGTVRITAMIMLVIIGAYFLNFTLTAAGMGRELKDLLTGLNLSPMGTLMVVIVLYIVLGFFIETLSLMVATIPIIVPIMTGMGFDKVWFGILLIVLIEMALITPPVGLNLYVVQGARKSGRLSEVMLGAIPFVLVMVAMIALLVAVPAVALFLPDIL